MITAPTNADLGGAKRKRILSIQKVTIVAAILLSLVAFIRTLYRWQYPYGVSHCCDLILYSALQEYAGGHNGAFPLGQITPEASLGLVYSNIIWVTPDLLRGRTVEETVVRKTLEHGLSLGPDSCGWHYVEGLRLDDDPRLALFWDKIGLGHNGRRLSTPGHTVLSVDGDRRFIPDDEWAKFLQEQRALLEERTNGKRISLSGAIEVESEKIHGELVVVGECLYGNVWNGWMRRSSELIANMNREPSEGLVGIPIVTTEEIRNAKVVIEQEKGVVRFIFNNTRQCVFNGSGFRFE
jgi:hypothetical protein